MLKKLAVPFLTLTLATFGFGCSSSTTNNGTGGSGGGVGGKGGGAGTSASGGKGGGANGKPDASSMADCTVTTMSGTDKLSAPVFCANLFAYCSNISGLTLPSTEKACEDLYTQSNQEHCRSYHMCWGVEGITMDGGVGKPSVHCPHTIGMGGVCTATDASVGN